MYYALGRSVNQLPRLCANLRPHNTVNRSFKRFKTTKSGQGAIQQLLQKADSLFILSVSRFHEITGYNAIEQIKQEIKALDSQLDHQRQVVKTAREEYNEKLGLRSDSQREMNELLMRKSAWDPNDLERFTGLYKDDHASQRAVEQSKHQYDEAERALEDMQLRVGNLMGSRYREEQLFSDRIRQASTWGTWVLMGINILLFVTVTLVVEPYKRRKLVKAFEAKVREMTPPTPAPPAQTPQTKPKSLTSRLAQPVVQVNQQELLWLLAGSYFMSMFTLIFFSMARGM